jgi:hypothetical protein
MIRTAVSRFVPATVAVSLLAVLLAWGGDASAQVAPSADPAFLSTGMDLVFTGSSNVTPAATPPANADPATCLTTGMDLIFTCDPISPAPESPSFRGTAETTYVSTGMDLCVVLGDPTPTGRQPQVAGLISGVSYLSTGMDLWLAPLGVAAGF